MKDLKDFHNSLEAKINIQNNIDNFAIEFAEWLPNNAYKESNCWRMFDKKDNEYTTKELLEIFKEQRK